MSNIIKVREREREGEEWRKGWRVNGYRKEGVEKWKLKRENDWVGEETF